MKMNPYLTFNGQCADAFKFYERCLGGKISMMLSFEETPAAEHVPADYRGKIMHARLTVGDQVLMGSDRHPAHPYEGIKGCSVALHVGSTAEAERVFNALAMNGEVQMPLAKTFWSASFGMLVDQYGVPWMINCEKDQ